MLLLPYMSVEIDDSESRQIETEAAFPLPIYPKLKQDFRNVNKTQLEVIPRSVAVDVPNFGELISSTTTAEEMSLLS